MFSSKRLLLCQTVPLQTDEPHNTALDQLFRRHSQRDCPLAQLTLYDWMEVQCCQGRHPVTCHSLPVQVAHIQVMPGHSSRAWSHANRARWWEPKR